MSRGTSAAARVQTAPAPQHEGRRIRTTLGELVAAAYDAIGPDATADDVARLLRHWELAEGMRPQVRID